MDTEVIGVVEAIGQHFKLAVDWNAASGFSVSANLGAIDGALVTRFVIKLRGDDRVHSLPPGSWIEKLALTREGHEIAFVIGAAARQIVSFENLTLWPRQSTADSAAASAVD
ncbi:hypothetical protein [Paraburkholderia youngii]|uniref:hypothetical protein n=1 Tax=Paraburkholderia youngii TaxID=2782701 RepID=UPI003D260B1B